MTSYSASKAGVIGLAKAVGKVRVCYGDWP